VSDLALKRLEDGTYDLDFESYDFRVTDGLENSVILSLGTFSRDSSLDNVKCNIKAAKGGWWADSLDEKNGELGSRLYESIPGKSVDESSRVAEKLAADALQWMIDDGIASSVNCAANFVENVIVLRISIRKPDGDENTFAYELNWEATSGI